MLQRLTPFLGGLAVMVASPLAGQDLPGVQAVRVGPDETIRVDGLLDEPAWMRAGAASNFRQQEPLEGQAATERTEVRVLFDGDALYVGVTAFDSDPDGVIARLLQRDRVMASGFDGGIQFAGDDAIALVFDPFHDHRNGVVFATNPNGAEFEALITDEGREINIDWRGVWSVRSRRTAEGWSAEFRIPLRTLRYPSDSEEPWGFNVYRVIRRKNEEVLWSSWSRNNEGFARISRAGHLTGLDDLPRGGANIEVKPYVLAGRTEERNNGVIDATGELDVGVDIKYEVKPGLLLDLTANTDFAQVEADSQQVNLTRFSLFFPEKRDFFLENAGIFEFGWRSFFEPPPFLLFFSRQIGIHDDGPVPVIGGARLTGRAGAQTVGFMNIVTDAAFDQERTSFSVARIKRDIGESNYVGVMGTDRRSTGGWNTTGGADFSFWPSAQFNIQGFVAGTGTSGSGGEGVAYRLGVDYQKDKWGLNIGQLGVTEEANTDMGFITRSGMIRTDAFVRLTPRPNVLGLRKLDIFNQVQTIIGTNGEVEDVVAGPAFAPEWESGESMVVWLQMGVANLDEAFDIGEGVMVDVGDYSQLQTGWFANTSRNRSVVLSSNGMLWWVYDGSIKSYTGALDVVPSSRLAITASGTHNVVDMPNGNFTADVASLRVNLAFSTRLFANALVQYNDLDDDFSTNLRLNFIHRPGSDLFVVFNEQRGDPGDFWYLQNRGMVAKVTYLSRF